MLSTWKLILWPSLRLSGEAVNHFLCENIKTSMKISTSNLYTDMPARARRYFKSCRGTLKGFYCKLKI